MGVTLECVEFGFLVSRFMQKMGREWSKRSKKKNLECDAPETEGDYQMKIQTKNLQLMFNRWPRFEIFCNFYEDYLRKCCRQFLCLSPTSQNYHRPQVPMSPTSL